MSEWSVYVESRGDGVVTPDDLGDLVDRLRVYGGSVSGGEGTASAQFTVDAKDAADATARATRAWREILAASIAGGWHVVRVEAMTPDEQVRVIHEPTYPNLLGVAEVATLLGVSKQRVNELKNAGRLPEPLATLASGPVWPEPWLRRFVEEWGERRSGRQGWLEKALAGLADMAVFSVFWQAEPQKWAVEAAPAAGGPATPVAEYQRKADAINAIRRHAAASQADVVVHHGDGSVTVLEVRRRAVAAKRSRARARA